MWSEKLREIDRSSRSVFAWTGLVAMLTVLGCSSEPERAARVVSLSPVASEVLLQLGARDALIAVDSESSALGGLGELPVVDLAGSVALAPDLVVVAELSGDDPHLAARLRAEGSDVIESAAHDFDDAYRLCHLLGQRLGRETEARAYVRDHSRPLAVMSAAAFGYQRPRVAAVVGLAPLEVAGGHSFTTDLIEIAGAESVTHGNDDPRVSMSAAEVLATAPDLVLVTSSTPMSEAERRTARAMFVDASEVAFLSFDPQYFWLRDAEKTAVQMHDLVKPLVRGPLAGTHPVRGSD